MSPTGGGAPYDRPESQWVCGRAALGRACAEGPDGRGRCSTRAECRPRRQGDGWICTRLASLGGVCEDGPLPDGRCCRPLGPCQPVPSARGWRVRAVRLTAFLCVGALALLAGPPGARMLSPGPLTAAHGTVVAGCGGCHAVARTGPGGWLGTGLGHPDVPAQAELCLACHTLGAFGRQPHGVEPALLARESGAPGGAASPPPVRVALTPPRDPQGGVPCASCHREHRGRDAALTTLADTRCQACHRDRFPSLAEGHPEFGAWPPSAEGGITFDHERHEREHFSDEGEPFLCSRCHEPDARGVSMRTASFERACASCHESHLRGRNLTPGKRGIAFLGVPTLADALRPASGRLAAWPTGKGLRGSAFVALLLSADASLSDADLASMGADASGVGQPGADPQTAARWLDAWLRLLDDVAEHGQVAVRARVATVTGREVSASEAASLAAGLPLETVQGALAAWLPSVPAPRGGVTPDRRRERFADSGGWYRQDADRSLRYRPTGHADPFLRAWIELASALAAPGAPPRSQPASRALLRELTRPASPGQCALCHTLREQGLRWAASADDGSWHPATRFAHGPHLDLQDRSGCATCHRLEPESDDLAEVDTAPAFAPMTRELCATCHRQGAAADACTTCHLYHRGRFAASFGDAGLRRAEPAPATPDASPPPAAPAAPAPSPGGGEGEPGDELLEGQLRRPPGLRPPDFPLPATGPSPGPILEVSHVPRARVPR